MSDLGNSNEQLVQDTSGSWPASVIVEGNIGAGKTTLATSLAATMNYDLLLEQPDRNPFLNSFYKNHRKNSLATQLYFLLQRSALLNKMHSNSTDIFRTGWVTDFILDRDRLFAENNLNNDELALYNDLAARLLPQDKMPRPGIVVVLQASPETLLKRIRLRNNSYEQKISLDYLDQLNRIYNRFFLEYELAPVLLINTDNVDLVNSATEYRRFLELLKIHRSGRLYFSKSLI